MTYLEFYNNLRYYAEEEFAAFQRKFIFTEREILGVRTPTLRKLAKTHVENIDALLSYPDTYYETVFIKLTAVSELPYEQFLERLEDCVARIDNWVLCDTFKAKCIKGRKQEFLPVLERLFLTGKEYYVRYVLVTLLSEYIEREYLPVIFAYIKRVDDQAYYVHMAVAWLVAEILVKYYEEGVALLQAGVLTKKTHNKAIQKAVESYRLNKERKEFLRSLKIK